VENWNSIFGAFLTSSTLTHYGFLFAVNDAKKGVQGMKLRKRGARSVSHNENIDMDSL